MYGGIYNRALAYLDSEPNKTRMILDKELKLETIKEKKLDAQLMARIEQLHTFVQWRAIFTIFYVTINKV